MKSFTGVPCDVIRARRPLNLELGTWQSDIRGIAICANEGCQHKTGTCRGQPRSGREFDYVSAQIHRLVEQKRAVYCQDSECREARMREYQEARKLRARKRNNGVDAKGSR